MNASTSTGSPAIQSREPLGGLMFVLELNYPLNFCVISQNSQLCPIPFRFPRSGRIDPVERRSHEPVQNQTTEP